MIRVMEEEDLEAVCHIDAKSFPISWNRDQYMYELTENDYAFLYVLVLDHQMIGFIDFWITFEICQLAKIAVLPAYRGHHYAHQLMDLMVEKADHLGCENISLEVRISNYSAQKLYEAYDFIKVNIRKGYYQDNGEDAFVLIKALGGNCL